MSKWYFCTNGKDIDGPIDLSATGAYVRENPGAYCWKEGMTEWKPVHTTEIRRMKKDGITPFPPPPDTHMSPKPSVATPHANNKPASQSSSSPVSNPTPSVENTSTLSSTGFGSDSYTDGIDFKIYGSETQYIELELDPGESAIAEAGAMMYKSSSVEMETVFGDGSSNDGGGLMNSLMGAGRRLLTNESLFTTVFTQGKGQGKGLVAFGAPFPGTIMPLKLTDFDGQIICQKDSFLAAAKGVQVGIHFQRKIMTGLFGGEGFILQKLEGDGWVFVHMGGTIKKIDLQAGQTIHVDTGCVAAMTSSVDYDIQQAGGVKTMLFGGEGLFFATITGPGIVWLQSLPFSRLAGRMLSAGMTGSQGESSLLGSFLGGN